MFCPLCKVEYRQGFVACSDCQIPLVASQAEAAVGSNLIWKGDDRRKCSQILDALNTAGVPFHSKESLKKQPWPWISILLFRFMTPKPACEFEVWVLRIDLGRAEAAVRVLEEAERKEEEDMEREN
jgi:hypothetical protein